MDLDPILSELEEAVWTVARRHFGERVERRAELGRMVREVSDLYLAERSKAGRPVAADPDYLPARLTFFSVADLAKVIYPLAELAGERGLAESHLDVLDVGAGCGSMSLGLLGFLASRGWSGSVRIDALDADAEALALFREVAAEWQSRHDRVTLELSLAVHDLERPLPPPPRRYGLVLCGNLLNELASARAPTLATELLRRLSPEGHLILLEPALRPTSRSLQKLRDELLARGEATVLAPCPRSGPCPALLDPSDWCHESRVWLPPPELRQLCAATRLRRRDLRWSYLTLCAGPTPPPVQSTRDGAYRVVSDPLPSKGKLELFLCGETGRLRATLLSRHRSPSNEPFRRLARGHLAWIEGGTLADGELRLDADTRVRGSDPTALE